MSGMYLLTGSVSKQRVSGCQRVTGHAAGKGHGNREKANQHMSKEAASPIQRVMRVWCYNDESAGAQEDLTREAQLFRMLIQRHREGPVEQIRTTLARSPPAAHLYLSARLL